MAGTSAGPGAGAGAAGRAAGGAGISGSTAAPTAGTTGAAGTSPAGTAGAGAGVGAAGGGAPTAGDLGEFFVSGAWKGYVWTSAQGMGSTIMPMDFKAQTTGMPRCVMGSVAATTDYSGIAMLGFNLNQERGASSQMTVTPTKAGVTIDVKNNATSPLRFQVTSGTGAAQQRWCATLTGAGGFIPWTSLNTACWDGSGTAYNQEPIDSAVVLVPGTTMAAVPFDFCVQSLAETDAPAGGMAGTGAAGSAAGSGGAGAAGMSAAGSGGSGTGGTTVPPLQGGCDGWASRYWDCCKPHCGWADNAPPGGSALAACDASDNNIGATDAANSCEGGPAYFCHSLTPWAAGDRLAYGYAAVAASRDVCGKCFQVEFAGRSHNAGNDPGSAALAGKTMIVQAINIGGDVGSNQFDIAIPGGGVGAFNACSMQWGVSRSELGAQYGGFLAACKQGANASDHAALKNCVMERCTNVFESRGLTELAAGCRWFVDWFQVADNPAMKYAEVTCPAELTGKGLRRSAAPSPGCVR